MLDILCLVFGIYIFSHGRVPWLNNKEVRGRLVYLIAGLLVAILPVDIAVVLYLLRDEFGPNGGRLDTDPMLTLEILLCDILVLVVLLTPALTLTIMNARPKAKKRPTDLDPDETIGYDPDDEYDQLRPPS